MRAGNSPLSALGVCISEEVIRHPKQQCRPNKVCVQLLGVLFVSEILMLLTRWSRQPKHMHNELYVPIHKDSDDFAAVMVYIV